MRTVLATNLLLCFDGILQVIFAFSLPDLSSLLALVSQLKAVAFGHFLRRSVVRDLLSEA